ncbi:hypothetical protein ACJZ2D_001991 [Fusarium nematophilum]
MDSLQLNRTTASQAMRLEDLATNPMRPRDPARSPAYFELLRSRRSLPVSRRRQDFLDIYHDEKVVIVTAATGSGKTTQIPQFILYDEWQSGLNVACTQPRRLAASSVATRVAEEMSVPAGPGGRVSCPSCVIVDEAHERTKATDILMALLKNAIAKRSHLKVVIISATLDTTKFQTFFDGAKSFEISGRAHPRGILLFLTSASEIEQFCSKLRDEIERLHVLSAYSGLTPAKQAEVFDKSPGNLRKCIVATNVAETSLTIDGIVYVVDTGLVKQAGYNPRVALNQLFTSTISQASAIQRTGRASRTQPGTCFRLYTEETYEVDFLRAAPSGYSLRFDLLIPLHPEVYLRGLQEFACYGFHRSQRGQVPTQAGMLPGCLSTSYGTMPWLRAINLAVPPRYLALLPSQVHSRSTRFSCAPMGHDMLLTGLACPMSDHITQLNVLHAYVRAETEGEDMDRWCHELFVNKRVLDKTLEIRNQLLSLVNILLGPIIGLDFGEGEGYFTRILKALARSMFWRVAIRDPGNKAAKGGAIIKNDQNLYRAVHGNHPAGLHPDSALVGIKHEWVIFDAFMHSGKQYMETVTAVELEWLIDLPYFQDTQLARRRNGELRQPCVKASSTKPEQRHHKLPLELSIARTSFSPFSLRVRASFFRWTTTMRPPFFPSDYKTIGASHVPFRDDNGASPFYSCDDRRSA